MEPEDNPTITESGESASTQWQVISWLNSSEFRGPFCSNTCQKEVVARPSTTQYIVRIILLVESVKSSDVSNSYEDEAVDSVRSAVKHPHFVESSIRH
jgi:endogenous inhibitor of DNA gyrase (YacG/DUF329 family)